MSRALPTNWTRQERWLFGLLPAALLATFAVLEIVFAYSTALAGWPFLISLVLIGIPHGAGDLIVNGRLAGKRTVVGVLAAFAGYVSLMGLTLAAFVLWPLTTLLLFGVVTAFHFGSADVEDLRTRGDGALQDRGNRFLAVLARGALIVALPFAIQPEASLQVVDDVAGLVGSSTNVSPRDVRTWAEVIVTLALLSWAGGLVSRAAEDRLREARNDAAELSVLTLAFSVLHPLFAMGLYFLGWHSWRHTRHLHRYLDGERRFDVSGLYRLHVRSLPLLVPTLIVIAVVTSWSGLGWSPTSLATVAIAAFVVVTPPHHLVVSRLHAVSARSEAPLPDREDVSATKSRELPERAA